jgi:UDP-galactopyranose mutase
MKSYLIVGCGFYGTIFARILAESGYKVDVIDKRNHIAGNCYTETVDNIPVHKYGPHAFHTNSEEVWSFLKRFAEFNDFKLQVKVNHKDNIYSFPINMFTLNQLYGVTTPSEAKNIIRKMKKKSKQKNFPSYILSNLGYEIYNIFFDGYTRKQWNIDPSELSESVAKRIPIRYEYNDFYFNDKFQGIPIGGYTKLFENILDHKNIKVILNCDFFENRKEFEKSYRKIIYSGKVDELFDYKYGLLEYRSLNFKTKKFSKTFQGNSIINFTEESVPYTRIVEHKYFAQISQEKTIVTYEYPENYTENKIPFYPMPTEKNKLTYQKYKSDVDLLENYIIGGRLGRYIYLNMDQVIAMALKDAKEELCKKRTR